MAELKLTPESSAEIIQRTYSYLAKKYEKNNLNIVDYTYQFTYSCKSPLSYQLNPFNRLKYFDADKAQNSEGFLFVNTDVNQHYFVLPSAHLIIECNNGQFRVFPLLDYAKDENYCVEAINRLFSSLQTYDFECFANFNLFCRPDFNLEPFRNRLDDNSKKDLIIILDSIEKNHRINYGSSLFRHWIRYFFNLPQNSSTFCDNVSFNIDLDLSYKEDFYILEKGRFNQSCMSVNSEDLYHVMEKDEQLLKALDGCLEKTFSSTITANLNSARGDKLREEIYYFTEMAKMEFFIPLKGIRKDPKTTYFSRINNNGEVRGPSKLDVDNLAYLNNSVGEAFSGYKLINRIYTFADIYQRIDFNLFEEQDDPDLDISYFDYDSVLVFGYKGKLEFIREYAKYQLGCANEILSSDENDPSIFNLSKDDFFKKMDELYSILNKTKELRYLDRQRYKSLIDDYIIKMGLDGDIHVI
jgi:hypothetical protein